MDENKIIEIIKMYNKLNSEFNKYQIKIDLQDSNNKIANRNNTYYELIKNDIENLELSESVFLGHGKLISLPVELSNISAYDRDLRLLEIYRKSRISEVAKILKLSKFI